MPVPDVIKRLFPGPVRRALRRVWPANPVVETPPDPTPDPAQWERFAPRFYLDRLDQTPEGVGVSGWVALGGWEVGLAFPFCVGSAW